MVIVVDAPGFDRRARVVQPDEPVLVEALVPQPAVERFHERILRRLSWCDVVPFDPSVLHPFQDRVTGQLRAVVRDVGGDGGAGGCGPCAKHWCCELLLSAAGGFDDLRTVLCWPECCWR